MERQGRPGTDSPWRAGRLTVGRGPRVVFGWSYEDHGVELATFPTGGRVLVIASAGDTAAALATAGHHVTAVDVDPTRTDPTRTDPTRTDPPDPASVHGPRPPAVDVTWVHADVAAHLRQMPAGRYDAVSLSNVLDGAPAAYAARLHDAVRHAVRPGAPVVLRTFGDRSPLPGRRLDDRSLLWGAVVQVEIGG